MERLFPVTSQAWLEWTNAVWRVDVILFFLLYLQIVAVNEKYDFAIYHDGDVGAWEDGIVAFEAFLDWKGVSHNRVTSHEINTVELRNYYRVIYFPGGDADYYNADISSSGIDHIRKLVFNGGGYIGICAGAEFACDRLVWQGKAYDYPLDLFMGEAVGPIDRLAVWPENAMVTVAMNPDDGINAYEPRSEEILYWGGTAFRAFPGTECDTVATYTADDNSIAVVKFLYGSGRVVLVSPHPEIEESSTRDGTDVAREYDDEGSDWNFLWAATDWLLGKPVSTPAGTLH
jgi:glutamine amidotransferase-like uncharacterized protein